MKKPSALAKRICKRYYDSYEFAPLWYIIDEEVARTQIKFKTDANGKKVVVKNGQVIGRQG
jgi:hypothetical protein